MGKSSLTPGSLEEWEQSPQFLLSVCLLWGWSLVGEEEGRNQNVQTAL